MFRFCLSVIWFAISAMVAHGEDVDFAHAVVPILKTHCVACHTGEKSEGGFSFNTQRQLLESGYVKPGNPSASRLIELIESRDNEDQMPPKDRKRLTTEEVGVLKAWVTAQLPWEPGFQFAVIGYEPPLQPQEVVLPPAAFPGQNPIDRILGEYYTDTQQQAPPVVGDHVFLRRVYMDLNGLLPTLKQQDAFASDSATDRRTNVIDQLLARDHEYAEHWITFWNDLLRNDYVGTGYIDGGRQQITAWLYAALLSNKPYDQFVRELVTPVPGAEGFINGIQWRGDVNASQIREIQFSQSVSQVFLGINMKCASCHDSFIDRWTLDEAYGLAAIYSTRELEIHRCDKPIGRTAKAAWIFPELGNIDPEAKQPERLKQLAAVLTSPQNGRFSRTIVNRLWHRLMGHGIVHPVDAMHTEPWNADLLNYLANDLVEQKYDLKQVLRLIATSQAYQSQSAPAQDSATSGEYVFHGPTARHLTAEQFIDSVLQLTDTPPPIIDAPIPADLYYGDDLPTVERSGRWIWTYPNTQSSPPGEQASFRKQFTVSRKTRSAKLVITCDNEYTAYLNGKKVGADTNWGSIESLELSRQLAVGDNEILIVGRNAGDTPNPAGLYAEILLIDGQDQKSRIATDETWDASRDIAKPGNTKSVEWQAASPVEPQNFLGPAAESSIKGALTAVLAGNVRSARSALLKSNLLMRSLGRPNREQVVTTRPESLSTLQAIDLANGEILNSMLASGAQRLLSETTNPSEFASQLFRESLCRQPAAQERELVLLLLGDSPTVESVQDVLWMLVMLPEFQFVP